MKKSTTIAAAALSAITTVSARSIADSSFGSFAVINHCQDDIYLWSVPSEGQPSDMITLPGGSPNIGYKEQFRFISDYGGVSVKASPYYIGNGEVPPFPISQLEYTVPPDGGSVDNLLFYDLSWVNGDPFTSIPLTMQTSTGQSSDPCPHGTCGGDGQNCTIGYLWSTDDVKTHACGLTNDIIWTFCTPTQNQIQGPKGQVTAAAFRKREAEAEADPLAACLVGNSNVVGLCDTPAAPSAAPSPAAPSSTGPSIANIIALEQQEQSSSSTTTPPPPPPTTTSSAPPPPPPTTTPAAPPPPKVAAPASVPAPAPAAGLAGAVGGIVSDTLSLLQLTNIQSSGVTQWLGNHQSNLERREAHAHSHAHSHNHEAFHRRKRIVKNN